MKWGRLVYTEPMNKELTKDGNYYIYKGVRIFKRKNGFSYVYFSQLPHGGFANYDTYPDTLKNVVAKIDTMLNNYPMAEVKNFRLYIIKKGNN